MSHREKIQVKPTVYSFDQSAGRARAPATPPSPHVRPVSWRTFAIPVPVSQRRQLNYDFGEIEAKGSFQARIVGLGSGRGHVPAQSRPRHTAEMPHPPRTVPTIGTSDEYRRRLPLAAIVSCRRQGPIKALMPHSPREQMPVLPGCLLSSYGPELVAALASPQVAGLDISHAHQLRHKARPLRARWLLQAMTIDHNLN